MDLDALTSNNMSLLADITSKQGCGESYENNLMVITESVLQRLYEYEEMKPFVELYIKLANNQSKSI